MTERQLRHLGWVATGASLAMYGSYVDQIRLNMAGETGSIIQPLAAAANCTLWVAYGLLRRPREWPIALANAPGVVLGAATVATGLIWGG